MSGPATGLRIGDAERAAAADMLARHFSHGRLDQAELDERLGEVNRAKTVSDLAGLFADLPSDGPAPSAAAGGHGELPRAGRPPRDRGGRRGRRGPRLLILALLIVIGIAVLTHSVVVWALLLLIAVLWLRSRRVRDRGSPPSTR